MSDRARPGGRALQHHQIALSVEALASAWARRDNVAGGSVVVADSEIAARRRLGVPWSRPADDTLTLAMVLRPELGLDHQGLLWLVGSLAAAHAGAACSAFDVAIRWPDTVEVATTGETVAFVNVIAQLAPGRIDFAVVALRFSLSGLGLAVPDRAELLDQALYELDIASSLLITDRQRLIDAVTDRSSTIGSRVKAMLLPRGEVRGRATALDPEGRLVLETPTGMLEHVAVEGLRTVEVV